MSTLVQLFPSLASVLSRQLRLINRVSLANQIDAAKILKITFDKTADAAYIYLQPSPEFNAVQLNTVKVQHGETVEVETPYWTYIDIDNLGCLTGIEILTPGNLKDALSKYADG